MNDIRHVPVIDRFAASLSLDSICAVCAQTLNPDNRDTGAGWPGNVWQIAMMCECIIIPTYLSRL